MHLWVRAEQRANERRVGITPQGAASLITAGFRVTVEENTHRAIPAADYAAVGCALAPFGSWPQAPADAVIFGLKELPDDGTPLTHRHILFGHAFKGQPDGPRLLARFKAGGGALYDLEYLTDKGGRRVAAFGYWAGFAGAAVSVLAWAAQQGGGVCPPVQPWADQNAMIDELRALMPTARPDALIIGAKGRVGSGAAALCAALDIPVTAWDMAETAHGGPFPEILDHALFFNCILAGPGCPVFVPRSALTAPRALRVIGDVACDPGSDYNPIPLYDRATDWAKPVLRVADQPPLDIMAIDNLPSLLPLESSLDFAGQLLPHLGTLSAMDQGVWGRARAVFDRHCA